MRMAWLWNIVGSEPTIFEQSPHTQRRNLDYASHLQFYVLQRPPIRSKSSSFTGSHCRPGSLWRWFRRYGQEVYGVGFAYTVRSWAPVTVTTSDPVPYINRVTAMPRLTFKLTDVCLLEYSLQSGPPIWWNDYSLANAWSNNLNLKTVLKLCAYVQLERQHRACSIRTTRSTNLKLKKRDTKVTVRVSGIQVSIAEQITISRHFA